MRQPKPDNEYSLLQYYAKTDGKRLNKPSFTITINASPREVLSVFVGNYPISPVFKYGNITYPISRYYDLSVEVPEPKGRISDSRQKNQKPVDHGYVITSTTMHHRCTPIIDLESIHSHDLFLLYCNVQQLYSAARAHKKHFEVDSAIVAMCLTHGNMDMEMCAQLMNDRYQSSGQVPSEGERISALKHAILYIFGKSPQAQAYFGSGERETLSGLTHRLVVINQELASGIIGFGQHHNSLEAIFLGKSLEQVFDVAELSLNFRRDIVDLVEKVVYANVEPLLPYERSVHEKDKLRGLKKKPTLTE